MLAAVVSDFSTPPTAAAFPDPQPAEGVVVARMLAAGVHQLVRSVAAGIHYSSGDEVPFVAGVDGIGIVDGVRVNTGGCPDPYGTIAEYAPVRAGWAVPVPDALDSVHAAAVVNPAMSSWLPLVDRGVRPGSTVAVLGATGTAGRLAVRIARHLGAERVVAAGRNTQVLAELAAQPGVQTIDLGAPDALAQLRSAFAAGIDIVLDYLWGPVAEMALEALRARSLTGRPSPVEYVQIGSVAGRTIALDAAILRARRISISGSGGGSMDPRLLFAELPSILAFAAEGGLPVDVRTAPLTDVASAWNSSDPRRLVITID